MSSNAPVPDPSLQVALHAATRTTHTNLNKTITARLPLCLSPNSSDPTAYYLGILTFGHIFLSFEQAIDHVLLAAPTSNTQQARDMQLLRTLSTDGLPRGDALNQDLEVLSRKLQAQNPRIAQIEERVRNQAMKSTVYISQNIKSRPWLALAYTWTMYLAMFNGGRWLYKQLEHPGPQFWLESTRTLEDTDSIQALSFWRFDTGPQDPNAEKLKLEFKKNFEQASEMLTTEERHEVVKEAVSLFDLCLNMIGDLDVTMMELTHDPKQTSPSAVDLVELPLDKDAANSLWHTVNSLLLGPAYRLLSSNWAWPMKGEVKAAD